MEIERLKATSEVLFGPSGAFRWPGSSSARGWWIVRLMVFPLLAGPDGREPAFATVASTNLDLVDHKVLDGPVLLVEHRPTGHDIPRA